MSTKTRSTRNGDHPINIHHDHVNNAKLVLRRMALGPLLVEAEKMGVNLNGTNNNSGKIIKLVLAQVSILFKKQWKEKYGWDFDDARDPKKLKEHITNIRIKNATALHEKMAKDMMWFVELLNGSTKDTLPEDERKDIEVDMHKVASSVYNSFGNKSYPTTKELWKLVEALQEAYDKKLEESQISPAESISWQKAMSILGAEQYNNAKHHGEATVDGDKVSYVGNKWYLIKGK